MERTTLPLAPTGLPLEGWVRFDALFKAIAVEQLVEIGWERVRAQDEMGKPKNEPSYEKILPILRSMRSHKVYPDRQTKISKAPSPFWEYLKPGKQQPVDRTKHNRLTEPQMAMGAAHFEFKRLIEDPEVEIRGTVIKYDRDGKSTTECKARVDRGVFLEKTTTFQCLPKVPSTVPDYSGNRIGGTSSVGGATMEVSDLEIRMTPPMRAGLFLAGSVVAPVGSITLRYSKAPLGEFAVGARHKTLLLNRHIAAIICLLVQERCRWTRWDILYEEAERVLSSRRHSPCTIRQLPDEALNGRDYTDKKKSLQEGLADELYNLGSTWPWLYGHLGPLRKNDQKALETHSRGKGIRYRAPIEWSVRDCR